MLVSLTERDGIAYAAEPLVCFARELRACRLCVPRPRLATPADVQGSRSSWAKKLGIPERRPAWLLGAVRRASGTLTLK